MQQVELNLSHYNLFCPATGQMVLDPEQFKPSIATVFCYLDGESEMSFALPWLADAYEECKEIAKNGGAINIGSAGFDYLTEDYLADKDNYVLFSIDSNDGKMYVCFDMNYAMLEEEENELQNKMNEDLQDIQELRDCFERFHEYAPNLEGYAVFSTDDMGVGVFNFCDTVQEFYVLCEATTFMEALDEGYEIYSEEKLKDLWVAFYLSNSYGHPEDMNYGGLKEDLNIIMEKYHVHFMGPVKELFEPKTEFSTQLIEEFGKNPIEFPDEYLNFLSDYVWG